MSDFKNDGIKSPPVPEAFLPYTILPAGAGIMLRTAVNPDSLLPSVFRRLWAVDRNITPVGTGTVAGILHDDNYAEPEFGLVTFGAFAGIGLVLVVIGVFSVMAYTVSLRRTKSESAWRWAHNRLISCAWCLAEAWGFSRRVSPLDSWRASH